MATTGMLVTFNASGGQKKVFVSGAKTTAKAHRAVKSDPSLKFQSLIGIEPMSSTEAQKVTNVWLFV